MFRPLPDQLVLLRHFKQLEVKCRSDDAADQRETRFSMNLGGKPNARLHGEGHVFILALAESSHQIISRRVNGVHIQRCAVVEVP